MGFWADELRRLKDDPDAMRRIQALEDRFAAAVADGSSRGDVMPLAGEGDGAEPRDAVRRVVVGGSAIVEVTRAADK